MAKLMSRRVRNSVWGAGLFLGLLAPATAFAGPVAELDCAIERLSDAEAAAIVAGVGAPRGTDKNAAQPAMRALAACGRQFDWTREEMTVASHYLPARVAQSRFRAALMGQPVDLAMIEREVTGDEALMTAAAELRPSPPELDALLVRLGPSLSEWRQRHGNDRDSMLALGGFIASTAIVEGMRRRFAR